MNDDDDNDDAHELIRGAADTMGPLLVAYLPESPEALRGAQITLAFLMATMIAADEASELTLPNVMALTAGLNNYVRRFLPDDEDDT